MRHEGRKNGQHENSGARGVFNRSRDAKAECSFCKSDGDFGAKVTLEHLVGIHTRQVWQAPNVSIASQWWRPIWTLAGSTERSTRSSKVNRINQLIPHGPSDEFLETCRSAINLVPDVTLNHIEIATTHRGGPSAGA